MGNKFNPAIHIKHALSRLVFEFEEASYAGTSGLIGAARENPARKRLESLLPGISAVGSGLVIDSYDEISRQQDIVIYERNFCPVFTINESPESTYYPCEGVIAVGEVKSDFGEKELIDAFKKISSTKKLKRYLDATKTEICREPTVGFRKYGSSITMQGTKSEEFDQNKNELDQIFGFIICNSFALKSETMLKRAAELWKEYHQNECPNIIVSLNSGFLQLGDITNGKSHFSIIGAKDVIYGNESEIGFSLLIRRLHNIVRIGRTVDAWAFHRYFEDKNKTHFKSSMAFNFDNEKITSF